MRVLAINDVSCIGKCSLSVSLPIISACGVTCDVLPTALLSTHTGGFENYFFRDLTDDIHGILKHWRSLGERFDVIYSGYLGNIEQIETVAVITREFLKKDGLFIVDPVMGDSGKLYAGFTDEYVEKMRELCRQADYILPNVTEACLLAGAPYHDYDISSVLQSLKSICPRPIVTGHLEKDGIAVHYLLKDGKEEKYSSENIDGFFCGAGDVFASSFVGALARGKDERTAIKLAADFTTAAIRRSAAEVADKRYGLNFEREIFSFLKNLNTPSND
ncbi:MAG: pyridoxamine kinase [Clostridia bacterium]|nr:pyridoxamine kinase [Clostridia bacterium]